jgi:hypothetical protein
MTNGRNLSDTLQNPSTHPDVEQKPRPNKPSVPIAPSAVHKFRIKPYFSHNDCKTLVNLSRSCRQFNSIYQSDIDKLRFEKLQKLFQAVIDDKEKEVTQILKVFPHLVLAELKHNEKLVIESPYTWLRYDLSGENAVTIAIQGQKDNMLEILQPYFKEVLQTDPVMMNKITDAFLKSEYKEEKGKIFIPDAYVNDLKALIDVFITETFRHSTNQNGLSDRTEKALKEFRNKLLPEHAIRLNYFNPELFLYAAYKAYDDNFYMFKSWDQRDFFCRYVIGFSQSLLPPKTAEKWCEGLYHVVEKKRAINERAARLKLWAGHSFYRLSRDSSAGLGFEYLCGVGCLYCPFVQRGCGGVGLVHGCRFVPCLLEKHWREKTVALQNLYNIQIIQRGPGY